MIKADESKQKVPPKLWVYLGIFRSQKFQTTSKHRTAPNRGTPAWPF